MKSEIVPWVESVGSLFGLTQEALDKMQWEENLTTSCSEERYQQMHEVVSNPASYYCPTGYYRLNSQRGGYLYLEGATLATATGSVRASGLSSVVKIERTADGGCYLRMQGLYLRSPRKDTDVSLSVVPERFYPVVKNPGGEVAFWTDKGSYSALHCGYSAVIGWDLTDAASYWTVTPAEDFSLSALVSRDGQYYHTLFAPFAAAPQDDVEAYSLSERDGQLVATNCLSTVPDSTAVLLRGASKTMNFTIADDDHSVAAGNMALRNTVADECYRAFNQAFLLYSGDSKNNHTYYRENLSTKDKLYFWQQALVILMVEDRYEFRGDRSTASLIIDLLDAFSAQEGGSGNSTSESQDARKRGLSDWTWNEYNDDLLWAGLAYIRGYLITGEQRFLDQAQWAWNFMYNRGWDDALGGGIWWSIKKEEKSGLSNNPAICMACYLYQATGDEAYLDKAKAIYDWVYTKLRKSDGSVDEKISADGKLARSYNVYNQGTFVEGAALLYQITGATRYRTDSRKTIEYVMVNLVNSKGIMARWKTDGTWQSEFARGMARHLKVYPADWSYRGVYTTSRMTTTYYKWMRLNADAAWDTRDLASNLSGCKWDETTPAVPSEGKTWECDACASAVVMTNVTPELKPGSEGEVYVDLDDRSADFAGTAASAPAYHEAPLRVAQSMSGSLMGTYRNVQFKGGQVSVLKNGTDGIGFYTATTTTTVKSNTAYLPQALNLPIDLSSLDNPETAVSSTFVAPQSDRVYDLLGRPVNYPQRGIYVRNGKKINY